MSVQIAYLPDPLRNQPWRLMIPAAGPVLVPGAQPFLVLFSSFASYVEALAAVDQMQAAAPQMSDLLLGSGVH